MRYLAAAAVVVAGFAVSTTSARAETVGVFRVDIDGVSRTAADKFERSIEEGLSGTGFRVLTRKKLRKALKGDNLAGCYFGACLKPIYQRARIRTVLVARISSAGPNYNFVVSLLDARTGLPTSQVADRCTVCTLEEAIASATLAVVALTTGTGGAKVTDPVEGPTRSGLLPVLRARIKHLQMVVKRDKDAATTNKRIGWGLTLAALIAGGVGVMQVRSCDDTSDVACWIGVGAGGALGLAGLSLLVLSR